MFVKKSDYIRQLKDNSVYGVIIADKKLFVAGKAEKDESGTIWTSYSDVIIKINQKNSHIQTLEQMGFERIS